MQKAVIFLVLIFAMLAATLHPAQAAHAVGGDSIELTHAVHSHDHDHGAQPDSNDPDSQGDEGLAHHHCPAASVSESTPQISSMPCSDALLVAARYGALPSRANDPLLEPPSA